MLDLLAGADGVVVRDERRTWRRRELQARSAEIAAGLAAAGVHAGQAVGVSLPSDGDLVATLFGVWQAGAVYVPINPRLTATEVEAVVAGVEPAALVTRAGTAARATTRRYEPDVALVQFTSGTTGPPKPVLLRHSGVLALLDNVVAKLRSGTAPTGPPPTNLIPVSLSLWAGIYQILFALRVGAPMVVMARFETVEFARLVREHAVRSVVLPPAAMAMLVDDERVASLEPLRFVRSITAPLSPLQARRFRGRFPGIGLLNGYGQTEIGGEIVGWNAADAREHGEDKLGSVGRPHAGVDVRVDAASGELQVRTLAVAAGYADGSDLGDRLTDDGWFRTGDVGRVDDDGFVWIEGRLSDVVNRGGLKVHPGEVEEVLRLVPEIADAAVVGVPDDRLGEVPWAFVVAAAVEPPTAARLAQHCRAHLAPFKVPVHFEVLDELPRNEIGKVLIRDLVARAAP
jgi:acyl-CoA synthetase (AMP-forming)/AMP-acid ligase II